MVFFKKMFTVLFSAIHVKFTKNNTFCWGKEIFQDDIVRINLEECINFQYQIAFSMFQFFFAIYNSYNNFLLFDQHHINLNVPNEPKREWKN